MLVKALREVHPACLREGARPISLYKILFYFEAVVHKSTILSFPPPTCIAHPGGILLHDYWTVYDSASDLLFVCDLPHNIGNHNIMRGRPIPTLAKQREGAVGLLR